MKTVLLTGAAGRIGTSLLNHLDGEYHFRCLDLRPVEIADSVIASVTDFSAVLEAMQGVDAVIHLATSPSPDQSWETVQSVGLGGSYNVFEAARQTGVNQVIFASTTLVLGWREMQQGRRVSPKMPVRPESLYGVGKASSEFLARHFSKTYGMSIICLRIGSFYVDPPIPRDRRDEILRAWCSPGDLAQIVRNCLETENLGFQVFYAVSNNTRRLWDIDNARRLVGYRPKDNAEDLLRSSGMKEKNAELTETHRLLFRAAVLDGPRAVVAWRNWLDAIDPQKTNLDTFSYRLLPLVYYNLAGQKAAAPLMARLKGVYRRTWLENQLCLQQVFPFLAELKRQGITPILLDDLTSLLRLYDGQGVRRIYSLDLLIRTEDLPTLFAYFQEREIWPKISYGEHFLKVETPLPVWPPFNLPLTIAWRAHPAIKTPEMADQHWQRGALARLGDCPVYTIELESHFLRACLRSVEGRPEVAFFALADVAWMLRDSPHDLDWERVAKLVWANHQVLPVITCLKELSTLADLPGIPKIIQRLQMQPISWIEHLELRWVHVYRPSPGLLARTIRRLLLYRRSIKIPGPIGFLRYFQYAWGGGRLWALPRLAVRHLWNAVTRSEGTG